MGTYYNSKEAYQLLVYAGDREKLNLYLELNSNKLFTRYDYENGHFVIFNSDREKILSIIEKVGIDDYELIKLY